jgi:hypothetical protein
MRKLPEHREESYDEYAERRWQEMQQAWREGRLTRKEREMRSDQIEPMIRREYYGSLH